MMALACVRARLNGTEVVTFQNQSLKGTVAYAKEFLHCQITPKEKFPESVRLCRFIYDNSNPLFTLRERAQPPS